MFRALWCLAFLTAASPAAEYFAAPQGTSAGDGSLSAPWDLPTALSGAGPVAAGDTVWITSGDYPLEHSLVSTLTGSPHRPITVRAIPGQAARLDCAPASRRTPGVSCLEIRGSHTWYRGLEIWNSRKRRTATATGSAADPRGTGVHGRSGLGVKLIHLRIHDVGTALFESQPSGLEIYGLVAYHNGWDGPDRSHGPGVYIRNRSTYPPKRIEDSVVFENYRQGLQGFGSIENVFSRFLVAGNVWFNNGVGRDGFHRNLMFGNAGADHVDNIFLRNVTFYSNGAGAGENRLAEAGCRGLTLAENVFAHGPARTALMVGPCREVSAVDNITLGRAQIAGLPLCKAFPENRCFDANRPSGVWVWVRPDRYEPTRALVIILNWDRLPLVQVDLSLFAPPLGSVIEMRSIQNLDGPRAAVIYRGPPIPVLMSGWGVAPMVGRPHYRPPSTLPEFGVFELRVRRRGSSPRRDRPHEPPIPAHRY